jgi:hypothetical protein
MCSRLNVPSDVESFSALTKSHSTQFILQPVTGFFARNAMKALSLALISTRLHCAAQAEIKATCSSSYLRWDCISVSTSSRSEPSLVQVFRFIFR